MYFHFNVDQSYLGATTGNEISIVTFVQIYETIAQQLYNTTDIDLHAKSVIADSINQIINILNEIKKWEVPVEFDCLKNDYLSIMNDHYETLMKEINND